MILRASEGMRGVIINLDTGLPVSKVVSFDVDKGEIEALVTENGQVVRDENGAAKTYRRKGRFKLHPRTKDDAAAITRNQESCERRSIGALGCAKCGNPLTLPGDDLCITCRSISRGKGPQRVDRLRTPLLSERCCHKGCGRVATWSVSDEVDASPVKIKNHHMVNGRWVSMLFSRGATVGRRFYCSWHFQAPRLLDVNGEVIEDLDTQNLRPE